MKSTFLKKLLTISFLAIMLVTLTSVLPQKEFFKTTLFNAQANGFCTHSGFTSGWCEAKATCRSGWADVVCWQPPGGSLCCETSCSASCGGFSAAAIKEGKKAVEDTNEKFGFVVVK